MTRQILYEDDIDGSDEAEITGNFELSISSTAGGKVIIQKQLGSSGDFRTIEEFTGPAERIVENPNTSTYRAIVTGIKPGNMVSITYQGA